MVLADILSRDPPMAPDQHNEHFSEDSQAQINIIVQDFLAAERKLEEFRCAQENDPLCQKWTGTVKKVGQKIDELRVWFNKIIQYCPKYQLLTSF